MSQNYSTARTKPDSELCVPLSLVKPTHLFPLTGLSLPCAVTQNEICFTTHQTVRPLKCNLIIIRLSYWNISLKKKRKKEDLSGHVSSGKV